MSEACYECSLPSGLPSVGLGDKAGLGYETKKSEERGIGLGLDWDRIGIRIGMEVGFTTTLRGLIISD